MAGPWEQYQQATPAAEGPWSQYQSGGIPTGRSLVDQIPGYDRPVPAAMTPAPAQPSTFGGKVRGAIEVLPTLAAGAVTVPIIEASKIYGTLTSGQFGTPAGLQAGERMGQRVAGQIQYQPRTQEGQQYTADIANALARTGLQGVPLNVLADFQRGLTPALQAGVDYTRGAQAARVARQAEEASVKDWARASQIEAAQAAQRLGVAVNPAEANPNVKTKMLVGATGQTAVDTKIANANKTRWNELAREDLGLPANTPLTPEAFEKARAIHYGPYNEIKKIEVIKPVDEVSGQLSALKLDPLSTSSPDKAAAVNAIIDRVVTQIDDGLTGENVIGQIRGFRKDATRVMKNPNASPIDVDIAETNLGIASALENLLERNITDPGLLDRFRKARTAIAKTHDWESATGVTTKQVDPAVIAKMAEKGKPLSGKLADVANVAGNFPNAVDFKPDRFKELYQYLRRGGIGGTAGFAMGGPVGAAIGAGITSVGGEALANMLAKRSVQNRLVAPPDRRIPLTPSEVEYTNQLLGK